MKTSTSVIISIMVSISALTWLVSVWLYDAMMSSMMTFYSPAALSLFVIIWTAGMAAMMFPAIVPMILVYNRLIDTNKIKNNAGDDNNQILYHKSNDDPNNNTNNDIEHPIEAADGEHGTLNSLRYRLRSKSYNIILFVSAYLAIWAVTGIILLVGWSFLSDTLILQLGLSNSQQQQQISVSTIYGTVLIVSGLYQFSSLKTKCLGYCESPLSFFMRRWQKGKVGALKMGTYHGLYCLGCCWPYFLLMVALGWMNIFLMGLFAAIIFAEKIWARGGLWIARITGIGFIILGIMSLTGAISLPSDSMSGSSSSSDDSGMMMSMDMSTSSPDNMMSMDMSSSSPDNMMSMEMSTFSYDKV